jgi:hypothetical protein
LLSQELLQFRQAASRREMNRHLMLSDEQYERLQAELTQEMDTFRGRLDMPAVQKL